MNIPVIEVAKICHQANKAYCESIGDFSQKEWGEAEQWQRDSAVTGVNFRSQNPHLPFSANHESWLKEKEEAGWVYGEVKDPVAKTHPCIVPYDKLPEEQKVKDALFVAIVLTFFPPQGEISATDEQPIEENANTLPAGDEVIPPTV